ncbi:MAG: MiaB/RimO family radical SAM methylthiotransferase [Bianqueaceae bacterium]
MEPTICIIPGTSTGHAVQRRADHRHLEGARRDCGGSRPPTGNTPLKPPSTLCLGANNFVPIVLYLCAGRERSRRPEEILKEISQLAQDGVKEVQLLGQNVNSYGKTLEHPISFAQLLQEISQIDGIERIRFMTSHPKDLSQDLIDAMATLPKVCPHFHLPLQSGSSRILEKMNRHYDQARYLDVVRRLREAVPDISLTTDIIVGFPGETDDDFEETVKVVRDVQFDSAFTFLYSKRRGTPAAAMRSKCRRKKQNDILTGCWMS